MVAGPSSHSWALAGTAPCPTPHPLDFPATEATFGPAMDGIRSSEGWPSRAKGLLKAGLRRARGAPSALLRARDRVKEIWDPVWAPPYPSVGVGIVTYNRPDHFRQVIEGAL